MASHQPATESVPDVHYTAFIRVPFPRGDFEDPPLVDWDASKDTALWKILSRNPRSSDLDWKQLYDGSKIPNVRFEVTLPFILQQAAWLYERQLSQVRAQMRKVSKDGALASIQQGPHPMQRTASGSQAMHRAGSGGHAMQRTGSGGQSMHRVGSGDRPIQRADSGSQSMQRTISGGHPMQRTVSAEKRGQSSVGVGGTPSLGSIPGTPRGTSTATREPSVAKPQTPSISRNPSTNTITQSRQVQGSSPGKQATKLTSTPVQQSPKRQTAVSPSLPEDPAADDSSSSSSDSSDESESTPAHRPATSRSQMLRRPPPKFMSGKSARAMMLVNATEDADDGGDDGGSKDADENNDDDDTPAFLPLTSDSSAEQQKKQQQDLGATLRHPQQVEFPLTTKIASQANTDSSVSSASSAVPLASPGDGTQSQRPSLSQLSPVQRAEITGFSPKRRGMRGREGSEDARSMGSSFSDLDDASVTQSALEEALMSNMQHGGASKMSNISQAFRSRYL